MIAQTGNGSSAELMPVFVAHLALRNPLKGSVLRTREGPATLHADSWAAGRLRLPTSWPVYSLTA